MNKRTLIATAASLLFLLTPITSKATGETLWNLTFKDIAAGQDLKEVPFSAPCSGPQRVVTDADNTLKGAASVGALNTTPLCFVKKTKVNYTPSFTLKADSAYTTGTITMDVDLILTAVAVDDQHPVETLMSIPFLNDKGGSDFVVVIVSQGNSLLNLSLAGNNKSLNFKTGDIAHLKTVLDLGAHTFQAFLNGSPVSDPVTDSSKFNSFLGLTFRDGTALGGNRGETFTAGIAKLVVTHQ